MQITNRDVLKKSKKRLIISAALFVALITLSFFAYSYVTKKTWPFQKENSINTEVRDVNQVDYGPPSTQDVEQSQDGKKNSANRDTKTNETNTPDDKTSVAVGVTFADRVDSRVEVRAFIPSVIESGTCTATFTKDDQKVTASSKAFIDSSSSQCNPIYIDQEKFTKGGAWSLVVSYSSNSAIGSSDKIEVLL